MERNALIAITILGCSECDMCWPTHWLISKTNMDWHLWRMRGVWRLFCSNSRPNWWFYLCPKSRSIQQICHPYVVSWHRVDFFGSPHILNRFGFSLSLLLFTCLLSQLLGECKMHLKIGQKFKEKKMFFFAAERFMNAVLNAYPICSKHRIIHWIVRTLTMLQRLNSWVILKSSLKKKNVKRLLHNWTHCTWECVLLCISWQWTVWAKGKKHARLEPLQKAALHLLTPNDLSSLFVLLAHLLYRSLAASRPLQTLLAKCWTISFFRLFHTWERHKQRPKNESKKKHPSYCRKNKANIV